MKFVVKNGDMCVALSDLGACAPAYSIPSFNDILKKEIDEWLYVVKHDQIPEKFQSPYMKQVEEKLNILQMTPEERNSYSYYLKQIYSDRDAISAAEARGLKKGKEEGKVEGIEIGKIEILKNLLKTDMQLKQISDITGFSVIEIEKIRNNL